MSSRTRAALMRVEGLGDHRYGAHRSHQLIAADAEWAHVILTAEADNVNFVRTNFAQYGDKAVQLALFVRYAPIEGNFDDKLRVAKDRDPSKEFDVDDPAGGNQETYDACARRLWDLAQAFRHFVGETRVD